MEKQRLKTSFFSILLAIFGAFFLYSETYYWVSTASGNWNDAQNWNTQSDGSGEKGVPSNDDDVIINKTVSITIDSNVEIESLQTDGAHITIAENGTLQITEKIENKNGTLTVNGTLEAASLDLDGSTIDGSGQIVAQKSSFTGTNLLIESDIQITETADSVVTGAFSVTNGKPSEGTEQSDYIAVYKNGWDLGHEFVFTWKGGDSTSPDSWAIAANWDLEIVPGLASENTAGVKVVIPDGLTKYPNVDVDEISVKTLEIGTDGGSTHDAFIELNNFSLSVTGDDSVSLTNYGTIKYTGAVRITDGATNPVNDASNGGTVEYSGSGQVVTNFTDTSGESDYANLVISGTAETDFELSVGGNLTVGKNSSSPAQNGSLQVKQNLVLAGDLFVEADCSFKVDSGKTVTFSGSGGQKIEIDSSAERAEFANLEIADDSSVETDSSFTVTGNWANNNTAGGFVASDGGITFSGSTLSIRGNNTFSLVKFSAPSSSITILGKNKYTTFLSESTATNSKIAFKDENSFGTLSFESAGTSVTFAAGKTQTVTEKFSSKGMNGNAIVLTTDADSPSAATESTWWILDIPSDKGKSISSEDFVFTKIGYSKSVNDIVHEWASTVDEMAEDCTANWFSSEYYWLGSADSSWQNRENWKHKDSDGFFYDVRKCPTYDKTKNTIFVETDVGGNDLVLESNIKVKNLTVESGKTIDLKGYSVTADDSDSSTDDFVNNGTVRLYGADGQIDSTVENGNESTVEYYADSAGDFAGLPWGTNYENLIFGNGANGTFSDALKVEKTTKILNGSGVALSLTGENSFGTLVSVGDEAQSVKGGEITLNSDGSLKLGEVFCDSLEVQSSVLFTKDVVSPVKFTGENVEISGNGKTFAENATFSAKNANLSGDNAFSTSVTFTSPTTISGSNTFTDFTCEKAGTALTFVGGTIQKVSGIFILKGEESNPISISGNSEWNFAPTDVSKVLVAHAIVKNSNNTNSDPIVVYAKNGYNEDGGGNTNWIFAGQEYEWTGADDSEPTKWDEPLNWSPSSVPQKYSLVTIPSVASKNYPVLMADLDLANETKNFDFDADGDGENESVSSSIFVKNDAIFDFAGNALKVNILSLEENARLRLHGVSSEISGIQSLNPSDPAFSKIPDVSQSGIIDYYGAFEENLPFGVSYKKLEFSAGANGTVSAPLEVLDELLIANGEGNTLELLSSVNDFQSGVKIGVKIGSGDVKGGDVTISGSDLKINADAQCSSITVNSAAQIENDVKTTKAQTYNGDVSFLADSTLHVETDAKITFLGDVGKNDERHKLEINGETIFAKDGTSAGNPQNVFASQLEFNGIVDGAVHLLVDASSSAQFLGKIGSKIPISSLEVHAADSVLFSGIGENESAGVNESVSVLAEKIELKSASYVSVGKQEFSGNVSVSSFEDGTWSGSEISVLQNLSFLFSENKINLKSSLSVLGDFLFDSGQFGFSGQKIDSQKNVIVFGEKYSPTDSTFSDSNSRFSFPERSPSEKKAVFLDISDATLSVGGVFYANGVDLDGGAGFFTLSLPKNDGSKVSFNSSASFGENQWGENWAAVFNCSVKNVHVEGRGGNAFISASAAQEVVDAGGNYSVSYENGDSLKIVCDGADVSGATGAFQFDSPKIEKAYTVYDDVLCVIFTIPVENTNGEVLDAALLSSSLSSGGLWISDGSASVSLGAFLDADCTTPFSSESAKTVYFKSAQKWNTDATGKSAGESESSDSSGVHQNVKVDISALSGLFAARHGHTHSLPFGSAGEPSFSDTEDHCRPVLIASYTGQEVHDATLSSQKDYDAHNFLEFQYSEAVDIADMTSALGGSNFRAGEENRRGALKEQSGDFPFFSDGFAEFSRGNIRAGHKIRTGESWSGEIDSEKPHAFYRQFKKNASSAEEVQSHRIRLSVAGYVLSESAGEKTWAGYIENALCPYSPLLQTTIRSLENEYIVDKAQRADGEKNAILSHSESSATKNHAQKELVLNERPSVSRTLAPDFYCAWDTSAPVFAPYVDSTDAWTSGGKKNSSGERTHELVGTVRSATNPYIEKIELHLFDGEPDYSDASRMWLVRTGWVNSADTKTPLKGQTGAAPEAIGGSRDKLGSFSSFTDGGIRKSSLYGAEAAFEYMYKLDGKTSDWRSVGETGILQSVSSPIFRNDEYYQTTQTSDDGLYFSVPLSSDDLSLGLPSRTTFSIRYNTETGFITDLAGNRLLESDEGSQKKTVRSLDITPPTFALTLAPISHNKIYAVFTKTLSWNGVRLGSLSAQDWSDLAQKIANNLIFVKSESDDVNTLDFPSEEIFVTGVEIALETDDSTALLLSLSRNVTLSDVEDLWIKVSGGEDTTNIFGEMVKMPYLRDSAGNCVLDNTCHALSDFALNAVNTLYAYAEDDSVDGDEWIEQGLYGTNVTDSLSEDYAVHDFSENSGNYGTLKSGKDITFRLQFTGGVSASGEAVAPSSEECEMVLFPSSRVLSSWLGDKLTRLTGKSWRVWLTTELDSYATLWNDTGETVSEFPVPSEESPLLYDAILKNDEFHFNAGNEWQFIFKIKKGGSEITLNHDGDTNTPRVPLYALWMPESKIAAGDFSFVDLWSFKIAGTKNQRGGVSILNNVIDATVREKTVVKVDLPSDGQLNVYVLTLDGGVVARLSRGKKSAGTHYFYWDGTNGAGKEVARGLYFVRVSGSGIDETRKVLVVK